MKRLFGMLAMTMVLMMVLAACSAAIDETPVPAAGDTTAEAEQTTVKDDDMAKATEEKDDAMDKEDEMKDDAMDKEDDAKDDAMEKDEDMKDDAMDKEDEAKDDTMDKGEEMKDDAMDKEEESKDDAMAKEDDAKDDAMEKDEDMKDDAMDKEEETKDDAMDDKEEATTEKEEMTEAAVEETTAATAIKNTGKAAPDFSLSDLDGNTVSLASLKGEKVYVKYWASWCSICVGGLPEIDQLSTADTDFEVVTIVTPGHLGEKSVADFKQWFAARGFDNITVLLDVDGTYAKQFGIRGVPTSAYIGSDGILVQVLPGHASTAQIEAKFDNIY